MADGITYSNKDVLFKVLSQLYQNKSLAVYGLDIPRIKRMLTTSYPTVTAKEHRGDNCFLLENDALYIQEYESTVEPARDFIKYTTYICLVVEQLRKEGIAIKEVIIGVIYTGDITSAPAVYDIGALRVQVKQVFLSKFNTESIYTAIKAKIISSESLSDEDILQLIVLPLTQPDKPLKQKLIEDTITLARQIPDESQQLFAVAGILTATDKFIDRAYSDKIKEWIKMTKVARLFEEEKIEAVNKAVNESRLAFQAQILQNAKTMLLDGEDYLKVMKYTGLTREEVDQIQASIGA